MPVGVAFQDTPVRIYSKPAAEHRYEAACRCGWHGRIRRHYGDAHRDKIRHRHRCPYAHNRAM